MSTGLVLPGGESTTLRLLMEGTGIEDAIRILAGRGDPILGTCAGAILLARDVEGPPAPGLGLLPMTVVRNAYGRQRDSAVVRLTDLASAVLGEEPLEAVFIRAPIIRRCGPDVHVLARHQGDPVLVSSGRHLIATFHPELTTDRTVQRRFLESVAQ